jgi:hypothetical protein
MTLSALRTKLPIRLASLHVHAHHDEYCDFELLPRPEQLNVLADRLATEVLEDLRAGFRAADKPTPVTRMPRLSLGWHRIHQKPGGKHTHGRIPRVRNPSVHPKAQQLDRLHL